MRNSKRGEEKTKGSKITCMLEGGVLMVLTILEKGIIRILLRTLMKLSFFFEGIASIISLYFHMVIVVSTLRCPCTVKTELKIPLDQRNVSLSVPSNAKRSMANIAHYSTRHKSSDFLMEALIGQMGIFLRVSLISMIF